MTRRILERRHVSVTTPMGPVRVKEAIRDGIVLHAWPEYEDLRRMAEANEIGLCRLREEVMALYRAQHEKHGDTKP